MKKVWITFFLFSIFFSGWTLAKDQSFSSFSYQVIKILDGDTLIASDGNIKFKVRLAAMDAPEKGQAYSKVATFRLSHILLNQTISIQPVAPGVDQYGRVLGHVLINGSDVAMKFVKEGLATYYRPSCKDYPIDKKKYNYDPLPYVMAENEAKKAKRNIWSDQYMILPCRYRRLKK